MNSRLDTIQAAILLEKIKDLQARTRVDMLLQRDILKFARIVETPALIAGARSSWAQFTLKVSNRDALQKASIKDIPSHLLSYSNE